MISGAVCFDKSWSPKSKAETIAAASSQFGLFAPRVLYESERIHIHSLQRAGCNFRAHHRAHLTGGTEWILGDIGYATQGESPSDGSESADGRHSYVPGCWLSVFINPDKGVIRLETDDLGLAWLFIARVPGGYLFSNHFGALARNLPMQPSLDVDALLAELAIARSYGQSTLVKEIRIAPPGSIVELEPEEMKVRARRRFSYGDRFAGRTRDEKFQILDGIYERIVRNYISRFGDETVMSLSGGYDSRTALACIHRHGTPPPLFTFASAVGNEVSEARKVAERVGGVTTLFEVGRTDWLDWTRRVEAIGTSGMLLFSGWCEQWLSAIRTKGSALVIGYLGDTITGKKIAKCEKFAEGADWGEAWANWEMANKGSLSSTLIRPEKKRLLREIVHDRSKSDFQGVDCAYPFQKLLHGDLYGRQARRVASQPNVLSRFVTPILFFYDRELIDFWCNLPFDDLNRQELYYAYGQSRFPELFPPRPAGGGRDRWLTRAVRLARGIVGAKSHSRKSGVIDHWSIIQRHRAEILALSKATECVLDPYLRLDVLVRYVNGVEEVDPSEAVQAINLMILARAIW
jgi:hypothetical protein